MMVKINRNLIVVSCLLPLFLLCSTLIAAQERDPAKGIIRGTIINETPNGASVENQEVILYVQKENSEEESLISQSDSSGTFEFLDLSTEAAYTYYLYLNYQRGEYTSATVSFEENQTLLALVLVVYDATTSAEKVEIAIDHIIIEGTGEGALLISESITFRNSGDMTYVGTKNQASGAYEVLRIPLPAGYQDIQYVEGLMECCVSQSEYGLSDSMDLKPGLKKVLLQYRLPYGGRSSLVHKSFQYRTAAFYILAPAPFELSGESLTLEGPLEIQGRQYVALGGEGIPASSQITFKVSQLPFVWPRHTGLLVVVSILAFVMIGISYSLLKKKEEKGAPVKITKTESLPQTEEYLKAKKRTLLSLIAHLDDQFEAKEITQDVYKEMRQELKERLVKIMEKLVKKGGQK